MIFTSGGTEANNLAIRGTPLTRRGVASEPVPALHPHLIISAIEHPSITTLADHLAKTGSHSRPTRRRCQRRHPRRSTCADLLRPETRLVAAMLANNETGVLQPVAELAAICNAAQHPAPHRRLPSRRQTARQLPRARRRHDDASPPTNSTAHSASARSSYATTSNFSPQLFGGFQQAGTPPRHRIRRPRRRHAHRARAVARRTATHALASMTRSSRPTSRRCDPRRLARSRRRSSAASADRLPHTSNIAFVGLDRQALFIALDQAGVACSTGSACASGSSEPSPVHIAMGCEPAVISSALRFSFGVTTTAADVDEAARRILNVCNDLRRLEIRPKFALDCSRFAPQIG